MTDLTIMETTLKEQGMSPQIARFLGALAEAIAHAPEPWATAMRETWNAEDMEMENLKYRDLLFVLEGLLQD